MPALADLFALLHGVLLTGFVSVTALLLLVTVANRLRVRHVLLSWRSGRVLAFPVAPALFIALVLAFLGYALMTGHGFAPLLFTGYLVGGTLWFLSGLFSASVIVTDCGILRHAKKASHCVGWGQVVDYFETARGAKHEYVFFYLDRDGVRRRFEVHVPAALRERFQEIVNAKLDLRFDLSVEETLGNRALER
jgi:hypothetical protein